MSTENQVPFEQDQGTTPQTINNDTLRDSSKHIAMLVSSREFHIVSAIVDEIALQREEICAKDEELTEVRNELSDQEEKKRVAINEMFAVNEEERAKQKETIKQMDILQRTIEEKDKALTEHSKHRESLRR